MPQTNPSVRDSSTKQQSSMNDLVNSQKFRKRLTCYIVDFNPVVKKEMRPLSATDHTHNKTSLHKATWTSMKKFLNSQKFRKRLTCYVVDFNPVVILALSNLNVKLANMASMHVVGKRKTRSVDSEFGPPQLCVVSLIQVGSLQVSVVCSAIGLLGSGSLGWGFSLAQVESCDTILNKVAVSAMVFSVKVAASSWKKLEKH